MALLALLLGVSSAVNGAVICGRVEETGSQKAVESANVKINHRNAVSATDSHGRYIFDAVPVGSWRLQASHIGFSPSEFQIEVQNETDTVFHDFRLTPHIIPLDEFVFTATRTLKTMKSVPVATELITRQDFQRRGAVTVADALETEVGYEVSEDFAGQGVMLQGVDPDKVLILVDGNRVIGRINGSIDLDQISVTNVKQIEVVKGSASTLYGSEAIGGIINIITDQPPEKLRIRGDVTSSGYLPDGELFRSGSFGASQSLSAATTFGKWGVTGGGRFTRVGHVDITPETAHTSGSPGSYRTNADVKLVYNYSQIWSFITSLRGFVENKDWIEDSGLPTLDLAFDDFETNKSYDIYIESLRSTHTTNRLSFKIYHTNNQHDWEKKTQKKWGNRRVIDYSKGDENFTEISTLFTHPITSQNLLTLGGDLYYWNINSDSKLGSVSSPFSGKLTASSAFVQDEWQAMPNLTIVPGFRVEDHEIYGVNFAPRLSGMYSVNEDTRVRASIGSGYRAPSSKELYYTFNHSAAGYIVYGNPELEPEKSMNFSISLEHNYQNASVARISLFQNNMRNLIDFFQTGATDEFYLGTYQYQNIYSAWVRGVEIERGFRPIAPLEVKLAYSFMESHNGLTGNQLLRRPKHSARWDLTYKHILLTAKVWGRFTSRSMFTDIFNTPAQVSDEYSIPYEVWNVSLSREWGRDFSVSAKVENLLDKVHGRYGPYEGRTVSVGMNWSLNR